MSFDISAFDSRTKSETGVEFPILHPKTGAPFHDVDGKVVTITLLGRNSDAFRAVQRISAQRDADRAARQVTKRDEDFEVDRFECLCATTIGWSFDKLDNEDFPFSKDNVRKLWSDGRWQWLRAQAYANVLNEGNFLAYSAAV